MTESPTSTRQPTIFEAAGGLDGLTRLAETWHRRAMADQVVEHAFSHGYRSDHTHRLAAYWSEALGGPSLWSELGEDETSVLRTHACEEDHPEMDDHAITTFDQAVSDVGFDEDPRLAAALRSYWRWAVAAMSRYHTAVPDHLAVAKWGWDGPIT